MNTTLLLTFLLITPYILAGTFNPSRVRLITTNGNNFFFRGNEPLNDTTVAYDLLLSTLKNVSTAAGKPIPSFVYINDYSLLSIEVTDRLKEEAFWKANPELGKFHNHAIVGSLLNPEWFTEKEIRLMVKNTNDFDNLPKVMADLKAALDQDYKYPVALYVHCEAGKDRTGEVSGSFYMKYLGWSFHQALYYDNHCVEGTRDISTYSKYALQWYCYHLKYVESFDLDCSVDDKYVGHC